jgi:hypothetical protein
MNPMYPTAHQSNMSLLSWRLPTSAGVHQRDATASCTPTPWQSSFCAVAGSLPAWMQLPAPVYFAASFQPSLPLPHPSCMLYSGQSTPAMSVSSAPWFASSAWQVGERFHPPTADSTSHIESTYTFPTTLGECTGRVLPLHTTAVSTKLFQLLCVSAVCNVLQLHKPGVWA